MNKIKVRLLRETSNDFAFEELKFLVNDNGTERLIASISTHSDSPEDNTIGRMRVSTEMTRLLEALGHEVINEYKEN